MFFVNYNFKEVNSRTGTEKSFYKMRLIIILFTVVFVFKIAANAQDTIAPVKVIIDTTLTFKNDSLSFLQKIVQPIKFRDNRNRKEKERVYDFMQKLIKKGDLKVDSLTVSDIMAQLDTINSSSEKTKETIDAFINTNELDKKASKQVIDSLKIYISKVIQEISKNDKESKEKQELLNRNNDYLKEIREIQFLNELGKAGPDSIAAKQNLPFKSIFTKTNVIGWHNAWNKTEYLNYNYNYLSALNLYGYELSASGNSRNPVNMAEFQKPGGVIEFAQRKNCNVHLTVFSKLPADIANFLNNNTAKKNLFSELDKLIAKNNLKGINIYFDFINLSDSKKFVEFISGLRQILKETDESIQLNISIPAIKDDESLSKISAYNFSELNQFVDYYLVLTDELTNLNNNLALTFSPLYNSNRYGQRTIESTINFYSNGKIPISKLIVTLSYLGIEWDVDDFSGIAKNRRAGKSLKYNIIIESYKNTQKAGRTVEEGIDSSQVAAFLNVTELSTYQEGKFNKKQIWFENSNSLYQKYNWVLENNLGGVAIRGLGYDDGYSELWDILGISFVKIDSGVVIDTFKVQEFCPCIYGYLKNGHDSLIIDNWKETWLHLIDFKNINPDSSYLSIILNDYHLAEIADLRYAENVPYFGDDKSILENKKVCRDLIYRWYIYSRILFGVTLFFSLMAILLTIFRNQLNRFKLGNNTTQLIIVISFWLSVIIAFVTLLLGLFFEPTLDSIGAGNQGESNFWILVKTALAGILVGIILKISLIKNRYIRKNQP